MNAVKQVVAGGKRGRGSVWVRRLIGTVLAALLIGWSSGAAMRLDAQMSGRPGFGRGFLHGMLMPLAWPTLLVGREQDIYALNNSGRPYKLGYSLGVNACGAAFFGWAYSRWRRWTTRQLS